MPEPRIIVVYTEKGGAAKTTTTVNLAAALAEERGRRVLVVDLDPTQSHATIWLGGTPGRALEQVFTDEAELGEVIQPSTVEGVDLIPSSPSLAAADKLLSGEIGAETILRDALQGAWNTIAGGGGYDYILFDTRPAIGLLIVNAMAAASEVFVPVAVGTMELDGAASVTRTIDKVKKRLNPQLHLSAVLLSRMDYRTSLTDAVAQQIRQHFGDRVLKSEVRLNVRLAEAYSYRQPIHQYAPRSNGDKDFRAVAAELDMRGDFFK